MPLTPTINSSLVRPHWSKVTDVTPVRVEYLQTASSMVTAGSVPIFAAATSSDDFAPLALCVSIIDPTAGAVFGVYLDTTLVYTFPTCAAGVTQAETFSWPVGGAMCGTVTTATVSCVGDTGNTATVSFYGCGMRAL